MARGSPSASPPSSPSNSLDLSHPGVRFRVSPRLASGVIPEVLRARAGWFEVDDVEFFTDPRDSWDVHFADVGWCRERFKAGVNPKDGVAREPLLPYQRVNHFPNHAELTRKDLLAKNVKAHRRRLEKAGDVNEAKKYDFMPETYALPNDYELFADKFRRDETARPATAPAPLYIAKPAGKAQGRGIFLFRRLKRLAPWRDANAARRRAPVATLGGHGSAASSSSHRARGRGGSNTLHPPSPPPVEPYVVQRYVERPLLIGGKKFDLRLYALVTSADPLCLYLYRAGFARFSTRRYEKEDDDERHANDANDEPSCREHEQHKRRHADSVRSLRDLRAHLTNVALNKTADGYNARNAQKFDLKALRVHLRAKFGPNAVDELFERIASVVMRSVLACAPKFRKTSFATSVKNAENCFETYGFDVLIDAGLKPWLVEVNAAPSFSWDTRADRALKRKVVGDALDVLDLESVVLEQYGDAYAESRSRERARTVGGFDLVWDDGPVPGPTKLGRRVEGLHDGAAEPDAEPPTRD